MTSQRLSLYTLWALLAACGTGVGRPRPVTRYPTKEVVRQDVVLEQTVDPPPGRLPTEITERVSRTVYYLFARDSYTCEVDYMLYMAVEPGDRVSCHWLPPSAAVESPS